MTQKVMLLTRIKIEMNEIPSSTSVEGSKGDCAISVTTTAVADEGQEKRKKLRKKTYEGSPNY